MRRWLKQAERDAGSRQDGLSTSERKELAQLQLRRDNRRLRMERERGGYGFVDTSVCGRCGCSREGGTMMAEGPEKLRGRQWKRGLEGLEASKRPVVRTSEPMAVRSERGVV